MEKIQNFINGKLCDPIAGNYLDNYEPGNGNVYCQLPNSNTDDVELAYQAANAAFHEWKNTSAEDKFKVLNKIAELIDSNRESFAVAESKDQGKPLWLARNEMIRAGQNFRFYATAALHFASESHATEETAINYTLRQPIGVVGCISPWNLPLYSFTWKIAPALAAGNCVVAKPSEFTPYTAFMLSKICMEAGLPAGVLNIVHGLGNTTGQAIVAHENIRAISFTGGTATGRHIAGVAAPMFKKLSLELGGKNPNIIFADSDLDKAVKSSINSSFLNQGEICLCGSRVFVEKSIYEDFKKRLLTAVGELKTGNPLDDNNRVGAIVSKPHFDKVLSYIELAKEEGGKILLGGNKMQPIGCESGWYIEPTVIEGLDPYCRTNQEEIFGPVITLMPFDSDAQVLEFANGTKYGLAATVWTSNLQRAHKIAAHLEVGIVWINCWLLRDLRTPFGGIKQSGVGSEGGWEAMRFFTEPKNVCISLK